MFMTPIAAHYVRRAMEPTAQSALPHAPVLRDTTAAPRRRARWPYRLRLPSIARRRRVQPAPAAQ
jgi:hypothetical protein